MIIAFRTIVADKQFSKILIPQNLPESEQALRKNFLAVGDKEKFAIR